MITFRSRKKKKKTPLKRESDETRDSRDLSKIPNKTALIDHCVQQENND